MGYKDIWKYLASRDVKHLFFSTSKDTAICGVTFRYNDSCWCTDKKGLAKRRKCKRCTQLGEVDEIQV